MVVSITVMVSFALLPLLVATTSVPLGDPDVTSEIAEVRIVSRIGDGPADDLPKRARRDQGVTMYVALRSGKRWYSDAGAIEIGGDEIAARPIARAPAFTIAWRRIEPAAADLSNTAIDS